MNKEIVLPTSKYFTLEMVADGIYALYSKEGSMARSNAGINQYIRRCIFQKSF